MQPDLTVVVTFHREGAHAYTALRSAVLACAEAALHGVACRIVATLDRADECTRRWVYRFEDQLAAIYELDYGDVSSARNYCIERIETTYLATLDGDDLMDRDWLWRGVQCLEAEGCERIVAHPQLRLTFGCEHHGRINVASDDYLFHPLNLIASWHYAADVIVPTRLYREMPFTGIDRDKGTGAEDWLWTCESIVEGVRHVLVPRTVSYYRRQEGHVSLGMLPGITFPRTRLLERDQLAVYNSHYPSLGTLLAEDAHLVTGAGETWSGPPAWVRAAVRRSCEVDLALYPLYEKLQAIEYRTPPFYPAVGYLYQQLVTSLPAGRDSIVIFCELIDAACLTLLESFLYSYSRKNRAPLGILLIATAPDDASSDLCSEQAHIAGIQEGADVLLRYVALGRSRAFNRLWGRPRHDLLARFLIQTDARKVINLGSECFDDVIAEFGKSIGGSGTEPVRVCCETGTESLEEEVLESWIPLSRARFNYSEVLCERREVAARLRDVLRGQAIPVASWGRGRDARGASLFGDQLCQCLLASAAGRDGTAQVAAPLPVLSLEGVQAADISCVIIVRGEELYLAEALSSLRAMCEHAADQGWSTECLILCDSVDGRHAQVLGACAAGMRVLEIDTDDESALCDAGLAAARGEYVALLSASDLVSPQWLARAAARATESGDLSIVHPAVFVDVTSRLMVEHIPDMESADVDLGRLAFADIWQGPFLTSRTLLQKIPRQPASASTGYGFSGWHWNCEAIVAGGRHLVAAKTVFYRRSPYLKGGPREGQLGTPPNLALAPSKFFTSHSWLQENGAVQPASGQRTLWQRLSRNSLYSRLSRLRQLRRFLQRFIPEDWDEEAYLVAHPAVRQAIERGQCSCGYEHYCRWGRHRGWLFKSRRATAHKVPPWLLEDIAHAAASDMALRAASRGGVAAVDVKFDPVVSIYRECWSTVSRAEPTHIVLMPSLRPGGAEHSALQLIKAVLATGNSRVLLITTDSGDNRWLARLPQAVYRLDLWQYKDRASMEQRSEVLSRLLLNSGAQSLYVSYSWHGWCLLQRYAAAISRQLRIYAAVFSVPGVETGEGAGRAPGLAAMEPYLSGVMTDNQRAAESMVSVCGIPAEKIVVMRHNVEARKRFNGPSPKNSVVLWAGRIDGHKRPDLLLEIASVLPAVRFHVYGTNVLGDDSMIRRLDSLPNVEFKGAFDGFDSIPEDSYAIYLHTAVWEGLPNALLEAMQSGLLAVAPDVGGIAEVVGDETGILIRDHGNAHAYAAAITRAQCEWAHYRAIALAGSRYVSENFTEAGFMRSLESTSGYLSTGAGGRWHPGHTPHCVV